MPKLIVKGNASNPSVKLSENDSIINVIGEANITIEGPYNINNMSLLTIRGLTDIEVHDNRNLIVTSSELPLENINIVHGTIDLNNNYEGAVAVAISVGENSKFIQTSKDLPMSSVTINAQAEFNFTHHGASYHIHNSAPSHSSQSSANGSNVVLLPGTGAKIEIKNPHEKLDSIIEIAKKLEPTKLKLNDFKYCEKFLDLLSENNNLSEDITEINSYINKNYFELTGVVKDNNSFGLPNELLAHISSYLNLSGVVQPALAGEDSNPTGE